MRSCELSPEIRQRVDIRHSEVNRGPCPADVQLQVRVLDDFLASGWMAQAVLNGQRAELGTAIILLAESLRQEPVGTLPCDDLELALLSRFVSVEAWREVMDQVLFGWTPQQCKDPRDGRHVYRLVNPAVERCLRPSLPEVN